MSENKSKVNAKIRVDVTFQDPPKPAVRIADNGRQVWRRMELHHAGLGWSLCRTCRLYSECTERIRDGLMQKVTGVHRVITTCPMYWEDASAYQQWTDGTA